MKFLRRDALGFYRRILRNCCFPTEEIRSVLQFGAD